MGTHNVRAARAHRPKYTYEVMDDKGRWYRAEGIPMCETVPEAIELMGNFVRIAWDSQKRLVAVRLCVRYGEVK